MPKKAPVATIEMLRKEALCCVESQLAGAIQLDTNIENTIVNSLERVEFIMNLEDAFEINLYDEEIVILKTFGDLLNLVNDKLKSTFILNNIVHG